MGVFCSAGVGEQVMVTMLSRTCCETCIATPDFTEGLSKTLKGFLDSPLIPAEQERAAGLICLRVVDWGVEDEGEGTEAQQRGVELSWGHTTPSMVIAHVTLADTEPTVVISRKDPTTESSTFLISGAPVRLTPK